MFFFSFGWSYRANKNSNLFGIVLQTFSELRHIIARRCAQMDEEFWKVATNSNGKDQCGTYPKRTLLETETNNISISKTEPFPFWKKIRGSSWECTYHKDQDYFGCTILQSSSLVLEKQNLWFGPGPSRSSTKHLNEHMPTLMWLQLKVF